ncbi:MAG: hypothetical protein IJI14_14335 [Anaerolineaceae bacterium]|nr:hypothetical protein [Anaerolineaceae bacterium]
MKKFLSVFPFVVFFLTAGCIKLANLPPTSTPQPTPVTAFETEIIQFEIEPEHSRYNAIVEIKNTGETILDIGYSRFSIEVEDGHLVNTDSSSSIHSQLSLIAPGESGYYFAAREPLPQDTDYNKELHLVYDTQYIKKANVNAVTDYLTEDVSFPDGDFTKAIGRVVNDTGESAEFVDVICICYDSDHNIVTVGGTVISLAPNEKSDFSIYNMAAWGKNNIVDYEIKARKSVH